MERVRTPLGPVDPNAVREAERITETRRRHSREARECRDTAHTPQDERRRAAARDRAAQRRRRETEGARTQRLDAARPRAAARRQQETSEATEARLVAQRRRAAAAQERYRGCAPISPVDTTWQDGGTQVRTQLPLRLCWAITMHKSQGQTLEKAVIDLGPKEACTGLTFVCLSRAKRLVDLFVEAMSFDRIGNLGQSATMRARLQEEVRLLELAQSTRERYTGMGVFNAVAGNQ